MSIEALEYVRNGMVLVPLPAGKKGPSTKGWNTRERCIATEEAAARLNGCGFGLAHAFSTPPTGAIDIDDLQRAVEWLTDNGIDLVALIMAPDAVQIRSGRPNRAKLLYRLPRAFRTVVLPGAELRCAADSGLTMQDAMPPSMHPDTGRPYEWIGDFRRIPAIPAPLLELWERLENPGTRTQQEREAEDAETDLVLRTLTERGLVRGRLEPGKYSITCPYAATHTTPSAQSDTVYWLPWYGGYDRGRIHCLHAHCKGRPHEEFLQAIGLETARAKPQPAAEVQDDWPVLDEAALIGLAGEIVRTIDPHSEADPVAVLLQLLASFGLYVGRGPHMQAESDQHHAALMVLLIGQTSKARKGSSWSRVHAIFRPISDWPPPENGLSTGEGMKWRVRDPIVKNEYDKKTQESHEVVTDPGVEDKRLLVVEPEFAQVLRVGERSGNTLTAAIRTAWDGWRLGSLTKTDTVTATDVHIAIIGHITLDELKAELTTTDAASGFANRFLFALVKRSKLLPRGGALTDKMLQPFVARIEDAALYARRLDTVLFDQAAGALWDASYERLSHGMPGLFGAATARGEAQVLRLALIYALMAQSKVVRKEHLQAALAVWRYCEDSARIIFGLSLGNRIADEIYRALCSRRPGGMTRTQIRDLFQKNQSAERIEAALELLVRYKLAVRVPAETAGRAEIWKASA